jgi:Arc/MetJ-type ribon-helix-helix transcriptional regulator
MSRTISLTVNLPKQLVSQAQELIRLGKVTNIDDFVTEAVQKELSQHIESQSSALGNDLEQDPILGLGENPVLGGVEDASENLDNYIYNSCQ